MKNKKLKFTFGLGLSVAFVILSFQAETAYKQLYSALAIFMSAYTMGLAANEKSKHSNTNKSIQVAEKNELKPEGVYRNESSQQEKKTELQEAV